VCGTSTALTASAALAASTSLDALRLFAALSNALREPVRFFWYFR
jgi:hypothetical protein